MKNAPRRQNETKDRDPPSFDTPRLGTWSVTILAGWCVLHLILAAIWSVSLQGEPFDFNSINLRRGIPESMLAALWMLGATFGLASGVAWIATACDHLTSRYAVRLVTLVAAVGALHRFHANDFHRNLANVGGLIVFQCMIFFLLRVPRWCRVGPPGPPGDHAHPRQFRIVDVIAATLAMAALFAVMLRYRPPIAPLTYWLVMLSVWIVLPLIAASTYLSALSRNLAVMIWMNLQGLMLTVLLVVGLSLAENLAPNPPPKPLHPVPLYGAFLAGFWLTTSIIGIASRSQSPSVPTRPSASAAG